MRISIRRTVQPTSMRINLPRFQCKAGRCYRPGILYNGVGLSNSWRWKRVARGVCKRSHTRRISIQTNTTPPEIAILRARKWPWFYLEPKFATVSTKQANENIRCTSEVEVARKSMECTSELSGERTSERNESMDAMIVHLFEQRTTKNCTCSKNRSLHSE